MANEVRIAKQDLPCVYCHRPILEGQRMYRREDEKTAHEKCSNYGLQRFSDKHPVTVEEKRYHPGPNGRMVETPSTRHHGSLNLMCSFLFQRIARWREKGYEVKADYSMSMEFYLIWWGVNQEGRKVEFRLYRDTPPLEEDEAYLWAASLQQ